MELGYTPDYVLDKMQMYEIVPIIQHLHLKVKDSWEQSRLIAWSSLAPHQKNPKPIEDFMSFSWEKSEEDEVEDNDVSIEDLKEQSKEMENILNGK